MSIANDVRAAATEVSAPNTAETDPVPVAGPGTGNQSPELTGTSGTERARDESGRFAPKTGDKEGQTATPVPSNGTATPPKRFAPPQSFRPTVRDHWEKTPLEVQEEIHRLEGNTRSLVQQSAQARKQAEQWDRLLTPYKAHIQGDPTQWADGVFRTAVQLQTAPPAQRAALMAQLIQAHGVDIRALDEALSGTAPQHREPQQPTHDPYREKIEALEAQIRDMQQAPQVAKVDAFLKEAEFIDEPMPNGKASVRDMVALNLRVAAQQGVALDLKGAYDMVVAQHPTIQEALKQRADAKATAERSAQTARAQAASTSVRTEPVVAGGGEGDGSIRDDVMASAAQLRRR